MTTEERDSKTTQIFFLCFSGILVLVLFLSKYLEESPRLRTVLSEPAMTLLIGIFFSFIVRIMNEADYEAFEDNYEEYKEQMQNLDDDDDYMNSGGNYLYENTPTEDEYLEELPQFFLWFPNKVFFMALLPPILFNSGYQLQRELFYRHFAAISLFSCLGTCISAFGAGGFLILCREGGLLGRFNPTTMELLTFGALIAATDTVSVVGVLQRKRVDPHLFSLVFGESALNDAVAIVLFKTLADFLVTNSQGANEGESLGFQIGKYLLDLCVETVVSPILGLVFASLMGLAFKYCDFRGHRLLELSLYILPVYIPFILSEILDLSGMITIFFTGIFARRYMEPNVSPQTREYSGILFQLFSFLAEICIFLELGLSVFGLHKSYYFQFISWAFLAALLGRALSVYPLSLFFNFSLTRPVPAAFDATTTTTMGDDSDTMSRRTGFNSRGVSFEGIGGDVDVDNNDGIIASSSTTKPSRPPTTTTDDVTNTTTPTTTTTQSQSQMGYLSRRETPIHKQDKIIPVPFMHLLWFAGLRGAVAYACAREFPDVYGHKDGFIAATMVIVLVTIVLMGGATEPLMECLKIRMNVDEQDYMKEWHKQRKLKGRFLHFEYNYIYRFVVRDQSIGFMDESCGYVEQVDDLKNSVTSAPSPRSDLGSSQGLQSSKRPSKRRMRVFDGARAVSGGRGPLLASDMRQSSIEATGGGGLGGGLDFDTAGYTSYSNNNNNKKSLLDDGNNDDGSVGFIETQLTPALSYKSSFDSGQYDWNVACGGRCLDGDIR